MSEASIPIVDFSACALTHDLGLESEDVKRTVDLIAETLERKGYVYLINHGLDTEDLRTLQATARAFFSLPTEEKVKSIRKLEDPANGWVGGGMELLGDRKGDLKECYSITFNKINIFPWPGDDVIPGFRNVNGDLIKKLNVLARRLFTLLGNKYSPQDPTIFDRAFQNLETENAKAYSCLRPIYYPPISHYQGRERESGQIRCGAHSDYTMVTFLMQDMAGGLQTLGSDGEWFEVPPLDGAILLQAGDMLEIWSAGRIKAPIHRVRNPTGEDSSKARECVAYFLHPDPDFLVKCLDGSDTYPAVTSTEYIRSKVAQLQASDEKNRENMLKKD